MGLRPCAANPHHLVGLRRLNPALLHHQLGLAVLLACGKPSPCRVLAVWLTSSGCGVGVMLQRGLVCVTETSFQKASQPLKHCFLEGAEDKQGSFSRILVPSAAGHAGDAGSLLYKTLHIPSATAMLSVGLLFCPFLLWLARVLRGPCFFPLVFGPSSARPQPQNAAICSVLLRLRFRAGLRAVLFGLLVLGPLARARDPVRTFWVGARLGPGRLASLASSCLTCCIT